jgi:hypothetical protein
MRRSGAFFAFAAAAMPAAAQPGAAPAPSAEQAIETQHRRLQAATGTAPCPTDAAPDEILVCGRRGGDPDRLPFPDERVPGGRVALLPGEPPSGTAALRATAGSPCTTVGPNQHCGGGLPVVGILTTLAKIGKHLLDGGD